MDVALFYFVIQEFLHRFILDTIHRVDFAVYSFWCILLEFNRVIPSSFWWVSFRIFFTEHLGELLVLQGNFYPFCVLLCLDGEFRGGRGSNPMVILCPSNLCDYWFFSQNGGVYGPEDYR